MASAIAVDDRPPFLALTLNRPGTGNLMKPAMLRELTERIRAVRKGDRFKAVVLRGAGKDFCLGRDAKAGDRPATSFEAHGTIMSAILGVYGAFRQCPVPVVAVVQGRAFGFGSGMIGACDIAIAADDARFSLPEMANGIPPTLVISALADVHRKAVADLVYSCREIDAATAHSVGLVSRVVPAAALDERVDALLARLRSYDRVAIQTVKQFLDKPGRLDPDSLSDLAGYMLATAFSRPR